jgi:hypothetical protein
MKPRVDLETSFISYLAGRASRDAITAARQFSSRDFWSERRHQYELVVSELVEEECCRGDQDQVARRKEFLAEASLLPISGAILELAERLVGPGLIPAEVAQDAIHVAAAAMHRCSFLLTWNFRHLANAVIRTRIEGIVVEHGYGHLTICTPDELAGA